jgi:hypothetical protein
MQGLVWTNRKQDRKDILLEALFALSVLVPDVLQMDL